MTQRIDFTQEGIDKVNQRIEELSLERKEVLVRLQTAREMGDLSENGAYKAARWELGGIDRELRKLTYLSRVGRVQTKPTTGLVGFGSLVTIQNDSHTITFTLVNGYESDPKEKRLSVGSPYGKAVFGKKTGDEIVVEAPSGEIPFRITEVK